MALLIVKYYVYILYSPSRDMYYKGRTSNLQTRLLQHNSRNVDFTKSGAPWQLVWFTVKSSVTNAAILERKLKRLNRRRLEAFMNKYS
jgi:putative endonuclease